ncbi:right-handed parallel beta-helix repeat-containing protein [Pseudomonas aeruginosa]|uniref:right-handed parallel beta-helix repeat-containing protein n=1 Tax=Pseudomonas aeruginosa TaxID=287 RepID=UPI0023592644|nr:right-handed parallel beta-helix repeat-containing protein [Pseudomonas aeruginosa]HBO0862539.1 right-handed parallel beta-helix repeat-containing protein [Pseudomonas aeruginosa]HBO5216111.1 right-handed parallel beta-helix repeat-containing protein [Pseudomonas aeruginosa]HCE6880667.1 right-handed parallel beta-helix repeat-containing protein [Pseudomonas aeruginosa]
MTTYATGNPIGSKDPRDLYDNAENFDAAMNDRTNVAWRDRFGVSRKTWFGIEDQVNAWLDSQGFEPGFLVYVDGSPLTVDRPTQLIQRDGNLYSVKRPASFPVTLSGNWAADEPLLVAQVDRALQGLLATDAGAGMIGYRGRTVQARFDDFVSNLDFGAIADGGRHPLSERFSTLAEAQAVYPAAQALTDEIDWCALQAAIAFTSGRGGGEVRVYGKNWVTRSTPLADNLGINLMPGSVLKLIDNAEDGVWILKALKPDAATEPFRNIHIYGSGEIDGNRDNQSSTQRTTAILLCPVDNGSVRDISISNIHVYAGSLGDGIDLQPTKSTLLQCVKVNIHGVKFRNIGRNGISVESGVNCEISGNHFNNCGIAGSGVAAIDVEPSGITLGRVRNVSIYGNTVYDSLACVAVVSGAQAHTLQGINVFGNEAYNCVDGYILRSASYVNLYGNVAVGTQNIGIQIYSRDDVLSNNINIAYNSIDGGLRGISHEVFGTSAYAYSIKIEGNQISNVTNFGINAQYLRNSSVKNNSVNRVTSTTGCGIQSSLMIDGGGVMGNSVREVSGPYGIIVSSCSKIKFDGNDVTGTSGSSQLFGARIINCTDVTVGVNYFDGAPNRLQVTNGSGNGLIGRSRGAFTFSAGATSIDVPSPFVRSAANSTKVVVMPRNAAAANLNVFYANASNVTGTSFRISIASGTAAGTEAYDFFIDSTTDASNY